MPGFQLLMQPVEEVYAYDGSLAGLYGCIHACVCAHALPQAIQVTGEGQVSLFPTRFIPTDLSQATAVREAIRRKISPRALELCENIFLTCMEGKELALLAFLRLGFQEGAAVDGAFAHPVVNPLLKAERHLLGEAHLLAGFVRFAEHQGTLYAGISPKNFVLPLLAPHFADRYSRERFLIHDRTHRVALVYDQGQAELMSFEEALMPAPSEDELYYQALWKRFYDTISIKERENPRCRRTHMPKRYWENMTEVQGAR